MRCLEAGHPRPDARSLAAGEALLEFAAATPAGSRVLLLVSGGASALLEVPAPGVGLAELSALFDRALAGRFDIERLNRERAALSLVKGGRLPGLFAGAQVEALMISDVPRDDPAVLASGLAGRARTRATPRRLARRRARRRRARGRGTRAEGRARFRAPRRRRRSGGAAHLPRARGRRLPTS